jgi:hypothetical protein
MAETPELADRAAYLPGTGTLVCADLHLGRAAAGRVQFPLGQLSAIPDRMQTLAERFEPRQIVLAGDILHSFTDVPSGVEAAIDDIAAVAEAADAELVFVRGNHDTMLSQVIETPPQDAVHLEDQTVVCHGHERPAAPADRYVIGHDHPAITIEGQRHPCYLSGPHPEAENPATVFVLPPFTPLASGLTVNQARSDDFQSPLIGQVGQFAVAVRDVDTGETLWFPELRAIRDHL